MSSPKKTGKKGFETEEIVRSYFLGAGFFVVRGVKLRHGGDDLTDIDLWLYERSATLARRRIIIDIKDNAQPKAAERLFFVKGLAEVIQVEATGVATSDNRQSLRELARKHNVLWIDNADLQRLKKKMAISSRISDEMLEALIARLDSARASRELRDEFHHIKSSVVDKFGISCANASMDGVQKYARLAIHAHPNSDPARTLTRLVYFCSAIAAAAFDFASGEAALRPTADRLVNLTTAIRHGEDPKGTNEKLRWAEAAIREFVPNGSGIALAVRSGFENAMRTLPAESLAEIIVKMTNSDRLFNAARDLEQAAYSLDVPAFDSLSIDARSLVGAILDFSGIDRVAFAKSWKNPVTSRTSETASAASLEESATERDEGKLL